MNNERTILSVGYYKGEIDFGVNAEIADFTYEQMKEFREMCMVAIGQAEMMWGRNNRKNPQTDLPTNQ